MDLIAAFRLFVRTLQIHYALLGRKRKYIKSKTTAKLKEKRTSIAAVRGCPRHIVNVWHFPEPPSLSLPTTLKVRSFQRDRSYEDASLDFCSGHGLICGRFIWHSQSFSTWLCELFPLWQCFGSESWSGSTYFGLPDPDPLVRGIDPAPDPSIIMQKL